MASSSSSNLLASVGSDGGGSVATAAANSHSGNLHQVIAGRYLVWGHAGTLPQLHAQVGQLGRDTGVHESPVSFVQDVAKFGPAQLPGEVKRRLVRPSLFSPSGLPPLIIPLLALLKGMHPPPPSIR